MHKVVGDLCWDTGKVWSPSVAFFATVQITDLKDMSIAIGAIVTMFCTVWVAKSTVRKNKVEEESARNSTEKTEDYE